MACADQFAEETELTLLGKVTMPLAVLGIILLRLPNGY